MVDLLKKWSFFIPVSLISILDVNEDKVKFTATVIEKTSVGAIKLALEVKNISGEIITVNKNRITDFKWVKTRSIGNYVIEIQILENGIYRLLEPSADIDQGVNNGEFIKIGSGKSLHDTITIRGYLFGRNGNREFKPGSYRLRVVFNSDFWGGGLSANTSWLNYEIGVE